MHEVFLGAFYFAVPFEAGLFHGFNYFGIRGQRAFVAGLPRPALDKMAAGAELEAFVVKPVHRTVDIYGRAVGVVAEAGAVAFLVQRVLGFARPVAGNFKNRRPGGGTGVNANTGRPSAFFFSS